jgi:hypothetical protein
MGSQDTCPLKSETVLSLEQVQVAQVAGSCLAGSYQCGCVALSNTTKVKLEVETSGNEKIVS